MNEYCKHGKRYKKDWCIKYCAAEKCKIPCPINEVEELKKLGTHECAENDAYYTALFDATAESDVSRDA